ncbi:hypothetical protein M422DRAFT_256671 [Sphaerobolus stellatus SS14]|uniref:Unplaced genomic scaffold SPHSTscaffold_69, whole genome shotgun sequence n=1 Tax=Sphaerobolus stellatus (strain SS14) TaxID=990650 RepID=A0A0C9VQG2_SPHS4|nr:hypothetical protein M422DRAFT_256671 [Sphaerobolus stellatus SS14]
MTHPHHYSRIDHHHTACHLGGVCKARGTRETWVDTVDAIGVGEIRGCNGESIWTLLIDGSSYVFLSSRSIPSQPSLFLPIPPRSNIAIRPSNPRKDNAIKPSAFVCDKELGTRNTAYQMVEKAVVLVEPDINCSLPRSFVIPGQDKGYRVSDCGEDGDAVQDAWRIETETGWRRIKRRTNYARNKDE